MIISRNIPLPLNPEAGFGAVADDGTVIFNDELVAQAGLNTQQINYQVNRVRADIRQRTLLYGKHQALRVVKGKTIIIIDDGLASGYTMMAAVASVRRHQPREIIVAVPAASATAREKLAGVADKVVAVAVGTSAKFYVADFYRHWHDLTDDEAVECLTKWRRRRFETNVKPRPGKA